MATNKNAQKRYITLDKCLSNSRKRYYIQDLVDACNDALLDIDINSTGIRKRQIYEDIKFMKDSIGYDAPIESFRDGQKTYYRYSNPDFSINKRPLSEREAILLQESLLTLSRVQGFPQFQWIEEITSRLQQEFSSNKQEKVIGFDDNLDYTGSNHIASLYDHIINKNTIEIEYEPFDKPSYIISISPYFLKQFNKRWFLIACDDSYSSNLSIFPLDRIKSINISSSKYKSNQTVDFNEYFDDMIGVTIPTNTKLEEVVLRISHNRYKYIQTKPLHGSQIVLNESESFTTIKLKLYVNKELEALILSYSNDMEVIAPESLKETIMIRVKKLYEKYFTCAE